MILYFSEYLKDVNLSDVKDRQQVTSYLNTLVNYDDPEKKYVSTYNIYLLRLIGFYRWLYNYKQDQKQETFWVTPEFLKIRKKQTKRLSPYNGTEIWEKEELQSIIKYETSIRNKAIITLLWDLDAYKTNNL